MPAAVPVSVPATESVIEVDKVATRFGEHGVHTDVSFSVGRSEIFALIGGSDPMPARSACSVQT